MVRNSHFLSYVYMFVLTPHVKLKSNEVHALHASDLDKAMKLLMLQSGFEIIFV